MGSSGEFVPGAERPESRDPPTDTRPPSVPGEATSGSVGHVGASQCSQVNISFPSDYSASVPSPTCSE